MNKRPIALLLAACMGAAGAAPVTYKMDVALCIQVEAVAEEAPPRQ